MLMPLHLQYLHVFLVVWCYFIFSGVLVSAEYRTGKELWDSLKLRLEGQGSDDTESVNLDGPNWIFQPVRYQQNRVEYYMRYYTDTVYRNWVIDNGSLDNVEKVGDEEVQINNGVFAISVTAGTITSLASYRKETPYHWDAIAWETWLRVAEETGNSRDYLWRIEIRDIRNPSGLEDFFPKPESPLVQQQVEIIPSEETSFHDLLKHRNIVGIVYLLIHHTDALGKIIRRIQIERGPNIPYFPNDCRYDVFIYHGAYVRELRTERSD